MTDDIGLAQGGRVIISENLTPVNYKIFVSAMKLKSDNKLAKVTTRDGIVVVKKTSESIPKQIKSNRDLDVYVVENEKMDATESESTNNIIINPPVSQQATTTASGQFDGTSQNQQARVHIESQHQN